jgi:hypothetical protein
VSAASCEAGAGSDSGCVTATLGNQSLALIGLNTDGDVDGNDMFHLGWRCFDD